MRRPLKHPLRHHPGGGTDVEHQARLPGARARRRPRRSVRRTDPDSNGSVARARLTRGLRRRRPSKCQATFARARTRSDSPVGRDPGRHNTPATTSQTSRERTVLPCAPVRLPSRRCRPRSLDIGIGDKAEDAATFVIEPRCLLSTGETDPQFFEYTSTPKYVQPQWSWSLHDAHRAAHAPERTRSTITLVM